MSKAQITGGYILYSEQAQPGTFGSPKGEARFDFGVEQDADYTEIAQKAAREAHNYVRRLIGRKVSEPVVTAAPAPASPPTPEATAVATVPAGTKEAAAAAMNAADAKPAKPKRQKPPAAETVEDPAQGSTPAPAATQAPATSDEWAEDATPAKTAVAVTDQELTDATSRKYKALGAGDATSEKIRALTKTFHGGPPKQLRDIPQERRADYLAKLEALA